MDSVGNSKGRPSIMPNELSDMLSKKRFTVTEAGGKHQVVAGKYQVENNATGEVIAICEREQWAKAIANNFNILVRMKGKAHAQNP